MRNRFVALLITGALMVGTAIAQVGEPVTASERRVIVKALENKIAYWEIQRIEIGADYNSGSPEVRHVDQQLAALRARLKHLSPQSSRSGRRVVRYKHRARRR